MIDLDIHRVVKLKIRHNIPLARDTSTTDITITNKDGVEVGVTLFHTADGLEIEQETG